jgi:hypothetical protein
MTQKDVPEAMSPKKSSKYRQIKTTANAAVLEAH